MIGKLGKYLLLERINAGGMADVYRARALGFGGTDQLVALKCIKPELAGDAELVDLFVEEAKLAVLLQHTNIVRTYELGLEQDRYYIVMEHVAGRDLRAVLDRAKHRNVAIPEPLALHVIWQVLEGLDYAHQKRDPSGKPLSIVHRDLSPHNVIVGYSGEVKLIDFGIAKAAAHDGAARVSVTGGKYGYMSPEQLRGSAVDARSDIFAAGVLFYELLTGERLFDGSSDQSILEKVRHVEIYPPSVIAPRVSPAIEAIVLCALGRAPADRYPSASEMHEAVTQLMLEQYGTPSARELAALMALLFADEIRAEARLSDESRSGTPAPSALAPPPQEKTDVDIVLPEQAAPSRPEITLPEIRPASLVADAAAAPAAPEPDTDRIRLLAPPPAADHPSTKPMEPTRVLGAYRLGMSRDLVILAAALLFAVALVLCTWLLTAHSATESGQIFVRSEPAGATVVIDGVERGLTPVASKELPPGRHVLTVRYEGFVAESHIIELQEGEVKSLRLVLRPGGR